MVSLYLFSVNQDKAFQLLQSGQNVFLTGSAGTGKTFVLNRFIRYLRDRNIRVAVTASTGIAATHLNGQTIHSWAGLGIKDSFNYDDFERMAKKKYLKEHFEKTHVLIIDEVSMLHRSQLNMVNDVLKHFRKSMDPFGGIQVVLCGDFFQLPPVTRVQEPSSNRYSFMSDAWVEGQFNVAYLTQAFRQDENDPLTDILDGIRSGEVTHDHRELLNEAQYAKPEDEPVRIYTHNAHVDEINNERLDQLGGYPETYSSETKGNERMIESLRKSVLAPDTLHLKEKARVMFVKNNNELGVVNGTTGTIESFDEESELPWVRTDAGKLIAVQHETWSVEDEGGKTLASVKQLPLRLAWAITVHKSQGMTVDTAEVDLTNTFETGQGYVALSRVKSYDGLRLLGYNETAFAMDPLVKKADARFQELSAKAESQKEADLITMKNTFLVFHGGYSDKEWEAMQERKAKGLSEKISSKEITLEMINAGRTLKEVAEERNLKEGTLLQHLLWGKETKQEIHFDHIKPKQPLIDDVLKAVVVLRQKKGSDQSKYPSLTEVKSSLNHRYSFDEIKTAMLFID